MAHLHLGSSSFVTSPERDALAALRQEYMRMSLKHRTSFLTSFSGFKTADELFQRFPEYVEHAILETVTAVARDVAARRVYHLDIATLRTDLEGRIETVRESFDRVQGQYFEILGKAAELEAQRAENSANRPGIVGGGFGLQGAATGIAVATAANVAIGLTYGLANLTAKAVSSLGNAKKKRELLQDPQTKDDLADFLCRAVLEGHRLVADTVNEARDEAAFEMVPQGAQRKASALVENVTAGRVPETDVESVLIQALELDPFADKAWRTWIDRFGDQDGSVENSADTLGVTAVGVHKRQLLSRQHSRLAWSTPEDCYKGSEFLETFSAWLGVPFEEERKRIEELAQRLDRERRTFNGVLYATIQEVSAARAAYDAEVLRKKAEEDAAEKAAAQAALEERPRTFNGKVYATVEEAQEARKSYDNKFWFVVVSIVLLLFSMIMLSSYINDYNRKISAHKQYKQSKN